MAKKRNWSRGRIAAKLLLPVAAIAVMSQLPAFAPTEQPPADRPAPDLEYPPMAAAPAPSHSVRTASGPPFEVGSLLALERGLQHGEYAWADEGVPAGPAWIHIDIAAQTLRVYRGASEIGRAVILYGADDKPTPLGTFKVTEKDANHVSNLDSVPMPYMLRLTSDGIAIHGSTVEYGVATHGCIGVPEEFAALLFAEAKLGMPVIITNQSA